MGREPLENWQKENLKTAPKNAEQALTMFKILCKKQKVTPFMITNTEEGPVYGIKELPTFKARFKTFLGRAGV